MRLTVISILGAAAAVVIPRVAAVEPAEAVVADADADAAAVCLVGISRIVRTMFGVLEIR